MLGRDAGSPAQFQTVPGQYVFLHLNVPGCHQLFMDLWCNPDRSMADVSSTADNGLSDLSRLSCELTAVTRSRLAV